MNLSFPFSLKHMALAKIVISVFNNPQIKELIELERTDGMLVFSSFEHQQEMFEKFLRKLSNVHLPSLFLKKISWLILPVIHEFDYWRAEHIFLAEETDMDLQCYIQWRSSGMINWKKTAMILAQNRSLDLTKRFILSCIYCLKNTICDIWNEMSVAQKETVLRDNEFAVVEHWVVWLKFGVEINWSRLFRYYIASSHHFFHETPLSLTCFSQELPPDERQEYFRHHMRHSAVINDDFLEYVHQMEPSERINVFREHAYHILFIHLEWPFQERFMYMASSMWEYLREDEFLYLFLYLTAKPQQMRKDFDYSQLAQEFWQASPAHFQDFFFRNAVLPYP